MVPESVRGAIYTLCAGISIGLAVNLWGCAKELAYERRTDGALRDTMPMADVLRDVDPADTPFDGARDATRDTVVDAPISDVTADTSGDAGTCVLPNPSCDVGHRLCFGCCLDTRYSIASTSATGYVNPDIYLQQEFDATSPGKLTSFSFWADSAGHILDATVYAGAGAGGGAVLAQKTITTVVGKNTVSFSSAPNVSGVNRFDLTRQTTGSHPLYEVSTANPYKGGMLHLFPAGDVDNDLKFEAIIEKSCP